MQTTIFCDIETGPLPLAEIQHLKPEFTPPANYKDPAKIQANLAEQEQKWLADGALSALTGRVLCIGTLKGEEPEFIFGDNNEKLVLEDFFNRASVDILSGCQLIGFCCRTFDFPFLIRRAWRYGIKAPACFFEGRYLSSQIVDVAERWACGGREPRDRISLDNLSKFLGTGAKTGDGKDFAALWASDRPKALEYLKQDLLLTQKAYERLYL